MENVNVKGMSLVISLIATVEDEYEPHQESVVSKIVLGILIRSKKNETYKFQVLPKEVGRQPCKAKLFRTGDFKDCCFNAFTHESR